MFYGLPRLHAFVGFFHYFGSISYNRRKQLEGLNLDIWTTITFLVSLIENPLCCGPQCDMGQFAQFGLNRFMRGQTHFSQLHISLNPDELESRDEKRWPQQPRRVC